MVVFALATPISGMIHGEDGPRIFTSSMVYTEDHSRSLTSGMVHDGDGAGSW
jgi:hypothetical protein